MTTLKGTALQYARKGIAVLPCNGKVPLTPNGYLGATTDIATIEGWWEQTPGANVGIYPASAGLLVLDLDVKGDTDGFEGLDILENEHGQLPRTLVAKTPSGGEHRYFKISCAHTFGNCKPIDGVDVRCHKGMVLAVPSTINGQPYAWTERNTVAMLPDAWVELLRDKPYVPSVTGPAPAAVPSDRNARRAYILAALEGEREQLRCAPEGDRNNALNRYGFALGQLTHLGLKVDDIVATAEWAMAQWGWTHGRRDRRKDGATLMRAIADGARNPREVAA